MTDYSHPMDPRLITAEVNKLEAEARMYDQQALDYGIQAKLKEAEVRQKIAHAEAAELGAVSMRVQTDATLRQEKMSLASNHLHHEYNFLTEVSDEYVECCLAQLAVWHRLDPNCKMHIILDSPGGSVVDGMHLFDQLDAYSVRGGGSHHVTITVRGMAASMAGILLQAADKRVMGKRSYVLIHQVSAWAQGSMGDLEDKMKWLKMVGADVVDVFMSRVDGKISREKFEDQWERRDWWLTAKQCLELGLIDEIG